MDDSAQPVDFEQSLAELEALVTRLEQGEVSLDESIRDYERGIELSRRCQRALERAEQRIRVLTEDGERPFTELPADDDSSGGER